MDRDDTPDLESLVTNGAGGPHAFQQYLEMHARIAKLEKCLKAALEFVPKSVAKRLTVQGGLG